MANQEANLSVSLQRRVICPHCWERFTPEQALWISEHSNLVGDDRLGEDHQLRFLPTRFNVRGQALDSAGFPCSSLACPKCHLEVPRAMFETSPVFWSILGAPACGKSYFLAATTWHLRQMLPRQFAISFTDVDPHFNRMVNEYEELLFLNDDQEKLVAIRKTELQGDLYNTVRFGEQTVTYPRPFLFGLHVTETHPNAELRRRMNRVLCLYDNAGEHCLPGQDSATSPVTRHLARSRALFFLFDPAQDSRFRRVCAERSDDVQLRNGARTSRQESILHELASRVRRHCGLAQTERHDRPLIVVVTKYDIWKHLLEGGELRSPYVAGKRANWCALNTSYVNDVSRRVRELLWRLSPEVVSGAESFAKEVVYIPVSALGNGPEPDQETGMLGVRPKNIRPVWIEVPLLYGICRWVPGIIPYWAEGRSSPGSDSHAQSPAGGKHRRASTDQPSVLKTLPERAAKSP